MFQAFDEPAGGQKNRKLEIQRDMYGDGANLCLSWTYQQLSPVHHLLC